MAEGIPGGREAKIKGEFKERAHNSIKSSFTNYTLSRELNHQVQVYRTLCAGPVRSCLELIYFDVTKRRV